MYNDETSELCVTVTVHYAIVCRCFSIIFCFQAEDGIRDLVRSRGLGDVYKRQVRQHEVHPGQPVATVIHLDGRLQPLRVVERGIGPVSYTHLTLPTSDLV